MARWKRPSSWSRCSRFRICLLGIQFVCRQTDNWRCTDTIRLRQSQISWHGMQTCQQAETSPPADLLKSLPLHVNFVPYRDSNLGKLRPLALPSGFGTEYLLWRWARGSLAWMLCWWSLQDVKHCFSCHFGGASPQGKRKCCTSQLPWGFAFGAR